MLWPSVQPCAQSLLASAIIWETGAICGLVEQFFQFFNLGLETPDFSFVC